MKYYYIQSKNHCSKKLWTYVYDAWMWNIYQCIFWRLIVPSCPMCGGSARPISLLLLWCKQNVWHYAACPVMILTLFFLKFDAKKQWQVIFLYIGTCIVQGVPKQTWIFETVRSQSKNDILGAYWGFLLIWVYEYLLYLLTFHFLHVLLKYREY